MADYYYKKRVIKKLCFFGKWGIIFTSSYHLDPLFMKPSFNTYVDLIKILLHIPILRWYSVPISSCEILLIRNNIILPTGGHSSSINALLDSPIPRYLLLSQYSILYQTVFEEISSSLKNTLTGCRNDNGFNYQSFPHGLWFYLNLWT